MTRAPPEQLALELAPEEGDEDEQTFGEWVTAIPTDALRGDEDRFPSRLSSSDKDGRRK